MTPGKDALLARRYRLGRRLGAGAMGAVYEALDATTGRMRAVKVMHAHTLERADLRERFALEATITARIRSPFIVDVLDAGVDDDGTPYLVMELLRGEDLSRRLKRLGRFEPMEALAHLWQTALALDETHRAGIVHRDLKPANLFLEEHPPGPPRVKVLDFGVAKVVADSTGNTTGAAGTPVYMAPEQFRGGKVGPPADVYALGMMAFSFLAGSAYWEDERDGVSDVIAFALVAVQGPKEPATTRAALRGVSLPAAFDAWFARATAIDASERFASAGAAVRALSEVLGLPIDPSATLPVPEDTLSSSATHEGNTEGPLEGAGSAPASLTGPHGSAGANGEVATLTAARETREHPAVPPRGRRWARWLAGGSGMLALVATVVFLGLRESTPPPPVPAASPLDLPTSVLACPVFEVSGVEEPSGWLGAAAAATACERARVILGGRAERTLVPAELLGLPRTPVDGFPRDPYAAPDARARSLEAARRGAAAYLDGEVIKRASEFRVTLSLHDRTGSLLDRRTGAGRGLYEAVRMAMTALVKPGLLPRAGALDGPIADWYGSADVDVGLAHVDFALALAHNAGGLPGECALVDERVAKGWRLAPLERWLCAYTLGLPAPPVDALPAGSPSSPEFAAGALVEHIVRRADQRDVADRLHAFYENDTSAWRRSLFASIESCLLQSSRTARAYELALLAVYSDPRNPDGYFCRPWGQLLAMTRDTATADSMVRAMQAWVPWDGYGWLFDALSSAERGVALVHARRAHTLSPMDTYIADVLADKLLASGAREEARAVALTIREGGRPVHRVEAELLLLRIQASEASFEAALAAARPALEIAADDVGWVRVQKLEIAWRALQIAEIVGRAAEVADLVVERFLDPEPPPLDGVHLLAPMRIPAICALASARTSRRCFSRFDALRGRLSGGVLPATETFVRGARLYATGDLRGAALAWKSLVGKAGLLAQAMTDQMMAALAESGDSELASQLEAAARARAGDFNGASLSDVRAARAAAAAKDWPTARALAEKVIRAWSASDGAVPAVEQMRKLLTTLK